MRKFGSVCSGIEAASLAFAPFGWEAAWLAEVDVDASAVLAHRFGATRPVYPPTFEDDPADKKNGRTAAQKAATWQRAAKKVAWGDRITNLGDMTLIADAVRRGAAEAPDMLCGGTPCQAFSVAGNRQGLADARGNLSLTFCELADAIDDARATRGEEPCVVTWENVDGALTSKDNAFGCILAALAGEVLPLEPPGGRWTNAGVVLGPRRAVAWRVGDAQYFGVAQRRKRVYLVASARDGFDPAAVLLEWEGVRRDSPPSREAQEGAAAASPVGADDRSGRAGAGDRTGAGGPVGGGRPAGLEAFGGGYQGGAIEVATTTTTKDRIDFDSQTFVVHGSQDPIVQHDTAMPLGRNSGQENAVLVNLKQGLAPNGRVALADVSDPLKASDYKDVPAVLTVALRGRDGGATAELGDEVATCLRASGGGGDKPHVLAPVTAVSSGVGWWSESDVSATIRCGWDSPTKADTLEVLTDRVRRLMPIEAERLQGFPDDHTLVPVGNGEASDSSRYKQIGNSWAVPHAAWVCRRLTAHLDALDARDDTILPAEIYWLLAA